MIRPDLDAALGALPIFPLAQVVLFPRARLALHVFEPRYRKMLAVCRARHAVMAVAMVSDPSDVIDERGHPRIEPIAGAGYIAEHEELEDGRSNIVLVGLERVRLAELPFEGPYRRARAEVLPDAMTPVADTERTAMVASAAAFIAEVKRRAEDFAMELPKSLETAALADACAHYLIISPEARQTVLAARDPRDRVAIVTRELAMQRAALGQRGRDLN